MDYHKVYGKNLANFGFLNDHQLSIICPEDVETILGSSKLINKSIDYTFLHDWLGTGLLNSFGKKWHSRRKIITPTFHFNILEQFISIFNGQSSVMVDNVRKYAESGEEFNIYKYTTLCALDVICEASMGVKINAQGQPESEYVNAVKEMSMIIFRRFFSILKVFYWTFPLTSLYREQKRVLKVIHGFSDQVIRLRRAQLMNAVKNDDESEKKMCFLDILLNATIDGRPLSNADIREEVDTFMFEGHDTTTSGIAFTLYHLSRDAAIQQRVYEEIIATLGATQSEDKQSHFDYRILQELKYLEMVIKESLRMTPPVPIIGRELTEDTLIGGVKVAKGTTVNIPVFAMHHSDEIYPQPLEFNPERFSMENTQKRHAYAYIPFSAGNRNCIGQKFAMLEVKSVIAKMVLNFKLLPAESKVVLQADLILKSTNGVNVRLEGR